MIANSFLLWTHAALSVVFCYVLWQNYITSPHHRRLAYRLGTMTLMAGWVLNVVAAIEPIPLGMHNLMKDFGYFIVAASVFWARRTGGIEWTDIED